MNVQMSISMTPELSSALTRSALHDGTDVSKEIEIILRENPKIMEFIHEIKEESGDGAMAATQFAPLKSASRVEQENLS